MYAYTIEEIIKKIKSYIPDADEDLIRRAYIYAANAHEGVTRLSGKPYIQHPLAVADLAATLKLDVPSICAALLHDVREDAPEKSEDMAEIFGDEITLIVEGVTKLEKYKFTNRKQKEAENFKKMLLAMSKDIRVLLVKLCDRLNNMRELEFHRPDKQKRIARETLTIYAPLATRLGINWIKTELEDLCFQYLQPEEYKRLKTQIKIRLKKKNTYIRNVINLLTKTLKDKGLKDFEVTGRVKSLYSIYRKLIRQNIGFDQVFDLIAFRVIVQEEKECWNVLGDMHQLWTPIPARFRDFLSVPKPNGYRSLHTTVFGPDNKPMEIQIRTWEMHHIAESGVAAHWKYKEGGKVDIDVEKRFNWLKQLIEWASELKNPSQFMESVEDTLASEEIYVFTPKGDLVILPRNSTPVDFAYSIHTEVGHHCKGAKVNDRLVPLDTKLKTEDVVAVLTAPNGRPSRDWINFVVTSRAKNKIRSYFQAQEKQEAESLGIQLLERYFRRHGHNLKKSIQKNKELNVLFSKLKVSGMEEIYLQIGNSKMDPEYVYKAFYPEEPKDETKLLQNRVTGKLKALFAGQPDAIDVDGVSDMVVHIAKCCTPIPGDPIIGFVTRGRGITIHHKNCRSVVTSPQERLVETKWKKSTGESYQVPLEIVVEDHPGMLAQITKELADHKINISSVTTSKSSVNLATKINIIIEVESLKQLKVVIRGINRLKGVIEVKRVRG